MVVADRHLELLLRIVSFFLWRDVRRGGRFLESIYVISKDTLSILHRIEKNEATFAPALGLAAIILLIIMLIIIPATSSHRSAPPPCCCCSSSLLAFSPIASLIRPNAVHRYLGTCHHGVLRSWKQLIGFVFSLCRLTGGIIIIVVITGTPFQSALGTLSATILGAVHARAHRHHGRYQQKRMAGNTMVGPVR